MATVRLIGTDTSSASDTTESFFYLDKFTALDTGKVTEIKVYSTVAGNVKVAIYANNGGEPGARLGYNNTSQAVSANQWNTLTIPETNLTKDTIYWLAYTASTRGNVNMYAAAGNMRFIACTYSTFTFPDPAGSGFTTSTSYISCIAGWGIRGVSPSSITQAIAYGTPKLILFIKPSSIVQAIAYGTPTVLAGISIFPTSIVQAIAYGTPALLNPQTLLPSSIVQAIAYGTPKLILTISPSSIVQAIAYGTPAISYPQTLLPSSIVQQIIIGTPALTKHAMISPDYPDWTESMQLTGTEIFLPVNIQGASVTIPIDIKAMTIGIISVDIVAQTVGNVNVNIAAQAGNINVNVAASAVTFNVAIQSSAVTINMDIKAQTVAVKTQGEWSPQAGQQKFFTTAGSNIASAGAIYGEYTVTAGKTLFITHVSGGMYGTAAADRDKDQVCLIQLTNHTIPTTLVSIGGHGGGGITLPTPIKIPTGNVFRYWMFNYSNHNCELYLTAGGYEL